MTQNILKQTIPMAPNDCMTVFSRVKNEFNFPLHYHEEYELNLILNGKGAKRIIGNHIFTIDDMELILVGPNVSHTWYTHECQTEITEITIQWPRDLFDDKFLSRNQLCFIKRMLEMSTRGICYSKEDIARVLPRILKLKEVNGFNALMELISILNDLSISHNMMALSDSSFLDETEVTYNSRRINKAFDYINLNYAKQITLADIAKQVNMTEESFSRFIKKRTGETFITKLNEIRLGHAARMLIETTHFVSEICFLCGFNNIANFNRLFKRKKGCTPKEFREYYSAKKAPYPHEAA